MSRARPPVPEHGPSTVIDSLEFARSGATLRRRLALADLPRLADLLQSTEGFLEVSLVGERDAEGKSWLSLRIDGTPVLRCQRCLEGLPFALEIRSRLQLIAPEEEWPDDDLADDDVDAIDADRELKVAELAEDEVLLALPIAPRHEQCQPPSAAGAGSGAGPFAALAALKKH
jgi:uncharacterized protein